MNGLKMLTKEIIITGATSVAMSAGVVVATTLVKHGVSAVKDLEMKDLLKK